MHDPTQSEQIDAIIDGLLGPRKVSGLGGILSSSLPRLDTSRPNIHESKKEFLRERDTVTSIIEHLEVVIEQVIHKQGDDEHEQMIGRLHVAINIGAVKLQRYNQIASASDLAIRNTIDTGFYYNSLYVVIEMINVYNERLKELQDQEKEFWSVPHRAPNYYARTIALRFARLYASEKQERPTFGISREGNHPSTAFGRALEEIFKVLGISASVRNAAEWAIEQLTDDDFKPKRSSLLGGLFGTSEPFP